MQALKEENKRTLSCSLLHRTVLYIIDLLYLFLIFDPHRAFSKQVIHARYFLTDSRSISSISVQSHFTLPSISPTYLTVSCSNESDTLQLILLLPTVPLHSWLAADSCIIVATTNSHHEFLRPLHEHGTSVQKGTTLLQYWRGEPAEVSASFPLLACDFVPFWSCFPSSVLLGILCYVRSETQRRYSGVHRGGGVV